MPPPHVYVHVPFCARRCSYCDFAIAVRARVPAPDFATEIGAELALRFPREPWTVDTLYLGGGTPSRLGGAGVEALLAVLRDRIALAPGAEVTLEANPDDVTAEAVAAWRAAGVNRLSLGAQSFDDGVLRWMHRTHDSAAIGAAVRAARAGAIDDVSIDLIFALPGAIARDWTSDLGRALDLGPTHVSLYGLTVEPHTPLGRWRDRGQVAERDEEGYEAEFLEAHRTLVGAGFEHYEVSNFARPGHRARHNASYWAGASYVGLGPSAHGFDGRCRRWNESAYERWRRLVRDGVDPVAGSEELSEENRTAEAVYLGLRTDAGLPVRPDEERVARRWISEGWASTEAGVIRLTAEGWLRLDALAVSLTAMRSR